jgi:dUTP pyrophosphatase
MGTISHEKTIEIETKVAAFKLKYDERYPIERATRLSVGIDIRSRIDCELLPGQRLAIPTGVFWDVTWIDKDWNIEMQIRPRSGLTINKGVVGMLGTVDADFTGEIHAILINHGMTRCDFKAGDKVGQMIIGASPNSDDLAEITVDRVRGDGGFGSTDRGAPCESA